jgi:hypothetical protein
MPLIAGLITTLFGALFTQVAAVIGIRKAVVAACIAAAAVLTGAFVAAMAALSSALMTGFPGSAQIAVGLYLAVPVTAPAALAAVFTCDAACSLYRWKLMNVRMVAGG